MATTRLGSHGGPRAPYGAFDPKTEAVVAKAVVTRLGLYGGARQRYAAFAPKTEAAGAVEGDLAATEAADTAAFAGQVLVQGDLAATEAADTASFAGDVVVQGDLAATEAADTAAFAGDVVVQGDLAATEGADTAAFTGAAINPEGDLAATEAADTALFIGDSEKLEITDTNILQLPINAQLADREKPRKVGIMTATAVRSAMERQGEIPRSGVKRLRGQSPSFTVKTDSRGYD